MSSPPRLACLAVGGNAAASTQSALSGTPKERTRARRCPASATEDVRVPVVSGFSRTEDVRVRVVSGFSRTMVTMNIQDIIEKGK